MKKTPHKSRNKLSTGELKALVLQLADLCGKVTGGGAHDFLPSYGAPAIRTKQAYRANEALGTIEAATYLGVSPKTLENWRGRGGGPRFMKMGSRCVYSIQDLNDYKKSSLRDNTSQF